MDCHPLVRCRFDTHHWRLFERERRQRFA